MSGNGCRPDILIFMSDQHGAPYTGWGSVHTDTPNLSRLKEDGISFENCYTSCPVCVPARMSMMSSLLPFRSGITGNNDTLPNTVPCFTHMLANSGYETVLAGRMHFLGPDQRHGFTKRIAPDFTATNYSLPKNELIAERGDLFQTTSEYDCCRIVGSGENIVNHYDRMVVDTVKEYLKQPHEKPQFIMVDTYAPHFPYISDDDLYLKYLKKAEIPYDFGTDQITDYIQPLRHLVMRRQADDVTPELAKACLAAYCAQVEKTDSLIGEVRSAFDEYELAKNARGIFGYVSDHGDMCGEHRIYGKLTFFDKAARVPMLFAGEGIPAGKSVQDPVSLMDLGPTVCSMANIAMDSRDAVSLTDYFVSNVSHTERMIISQQIEAMGPMKTAGMMLRKGKYKYIIYHGYEDHALLFDMEKDPGETVNLAGILPDIADEFAAASNNICNFEEALDIRSRHDDHMKILAEFERKHGCSYDERWKDNPPSAKGQLHIKAAWSPLPSPEQMRARMMKRMKR